MPPDLVEQVARVHEASLALGVQIVTAGGFEADDVIGTLARRSRPRDSTTVAAASFAAGVTIIFCAGIVLTTAACGVRVSAQDFPAAEVVRPRRHREEVAARLPGVGRHPGESRDPVLHLVALRALNTGVRRYDEL